MTDRLYRSPTDHALTGVAGGLATWLDLDPSLVRVAWVLLAILSGGIFLVLYIVMAVVVPLPPPGWIPRPRGDGMPPSAPWPSGRRGSGTAGIVVGAALVLLGAWFLVERYIDIDWGLVWPVGVIALGVALIAGSLARGRSSGS